MDKQVPLHNSAWIRHTLQLEQCQLVMACQAVYILCPGHIMFVQSKRL